MGQFNHMMEQVRRLKNGVGVQSLLDAACAILGNPIIMFNTAYTLIAYTETQTGDPLWNEMVASGTICKETKAFLEEEGYIEEMANTARIVLLKSKKIKYDRIAGKVFNKNNAYVANLVIVACNQPFAENDVKVFEVICKLISREIGRDEQYLAYERGYQEEIIKSLIEGDAGNRPDTAQVGVMYDALGSGIYVAVADISQCAPDQESAADIIDLLRQVKPLYKYAQYAEYIVILLSTNDDMLNVSKELKELAILFERKNIYAGISRRFENLYELHKYYMEALKMMRYALEARSKQRIFPCEERSIRKLEQIEALENGLGIQYFLNKGAEIFGNPLLFHDMEPNLLGYTENAEIIDPIWKELVTYGTGSDETVELFRTEGWIDIMDNTRGGALLVSDKCKYDRISWRIYNNDNIRFGCTSIVNTAKPFSEDELVLFGTFSQRFSIEVKKIELYNDIGRVYSETVINRLISGRMDGYTFYSEDIGNLYDDFMESLYLVAVDTAQCTSKQINLTYIRELFNWPGTVNRYAIYADYIVIIISGDTVSLQERDEFREINRVFEQYTIYAGISSCFEDVYELQKYYGEAVHALQTGLEHKTPDNRQRIFQYAETER